MTSRLRFDRQTSEELDHSLRSFQESMRSLPPVGGWARAVRQALGMSAEQLARRVGVKRATIATLERSEARGRITLASLEKLARGLGCRVSYALVPEVAPSLSGLRRARARKLARSRLASALGAEAAGLGAEHARRQLERLTDELLAGSPRKLWE
jgi:predicted DNA-binding mobile mystery protein A